MLDAKDLQRLLFVIDDLNRRLFWLASLCGQKESCHWQTFDVGNDLADTLEHQIAHAGILKGHFYVACTVALLARFAETNHDAALFTRSHPGGGFDELERGRCG